MGSPAVGGRSWSLVEWPQDSHGSHPLGCSHSSLGRRSGYRSWYNYKVRAGVFHIGAEVTSGHYRSFWYCPDHATLLTGDDAVRPTQASASDTKRVKEGSFLLILVRQ